jgi:hypothetical protein
MIDYWLTTAGTPVRLDVLAPNGSVVRSLSSDSLRDTTNARAGTPRLPSRAGLNRFVWDMSYPGPWSPNANQRGRNGPMAVPGQYTVRLTSGEQTFTQPLVLRADPRALKDGITQGVLEAQLAHNLRTRDLVSDANAAADELRAARVRLTSNGAAAPPALLALEAELLTPPIRYSRPGLLSHITYLYSMSLGADQPVSRDAIDRYTELRRRLDEVRGRIRSLG